MRTRTKARTATAISATSDVLNGHYNDAVADIASSIVKIGVGEIAKKIPFFVDLGLATEANPLGGAVILTFGDSGPGNQADQANDLKEKNSADFKSKVIGALLLYFEKQNQLTIVAPAAPQVDPNPSRTDNTRVENDACTAPAN